MSLTTLVTNRNSFLWDLLKNKESVIPLQNYCQALSAQMPQNFGRISSALNDRATIGMAMRYALMALFGDKALANHPLSKHAQYELNLPPFNEIFVEFGRNYEAALLFLAFIDAKLRGHRHEPIVETLIHEASYKKDGLRSIPQHPRWAACIKDIHDLDVEMHHHFTMESVRYTAIECLFCRTIQVPEKIWSCQKCSAPLTYDGNNVSSLSLHAQRPIKGASIDLIPTLAYAVGGADAPLSVAHQLFSIRTLSKPQVLPEHLLMAWGWKALYDEDEAPPWETFTIYYSRQKWELTLEFNSVSKLLKLDPQEFRDAVKENDNSRFDYDSFGRIEDDPFHMF